jgi:RNA polymerase primary sigma factor
MNCSRMNDSFGAHPLQVYLKEIKQESLLTAAEECFLAEAIARGDKDARIRMIQANLRLVVKIARDYVGRGMILEDLIGEGNLGLIRATEEFEPRFGTRFSTYAGYWIKQSIRHALINTTSTIRLPAHMVGLLTKWRRTERALCREMSRAPSFQDVATVLGLTEVQKSLVAKALQARQLKLESTIAVGVGWKSVIGSSGTSESPGAMLEAGDEWDILWGRMDRLDARERTILVLRYGLEGESPLTLKEIGRRLGVTREWVRKIEIRAVRKLDDNYAHDAGAGARPSLRKQKSADVSAPAIPVASMAADDRARRPRVRQPARPRAGYRTEQTLAPPVRLRRRPPGEQKASPYCPC